MSRRTLPRTSVLDGPVLEAALLEAGLSQVQARAAVVSVWKHVLAGRDDLAEVEGLPKEVRGKGEEGILGEVPPRPGAPGERAEPGITLDFLPPLVELRAALPVGSRAAFGRLACEP